jgi:hypothetical protein
MGRRNGGENVCFDFGIDNRCRAFYSALFLQQLETVEIFQE